MWGKPLEQPIKKPFENSHFGSPLQPELLLHPSVLNGKRPVLRPICVFTRTPIDFVESHFANPPS